jgi:hypothetical protein
MIQQITSEAALETVLCVCVCLCIFQHTLQHQVILFHILDAPDQNLCSATGYVTEAYNFLLS